MRLETERLLIRPFVPEDAAELFQVLSDPEVMRFLEPPFNWEQTEAFLQEAGFASPPLIYALEQKDNGRLAGSCIFHPYDGPEEYELGWVLRRDCRALREKSLRPLLPGPGGWAWKALS